MKSPHQVHYVRWCIDEIKRSTGFQYPAMTDMLGQVWERRQNSESDNSNTPWMDFVSDALVAQHMRRQLTHLHLDRFGKVAISARVSLFLVNTKRR